MGCLPIEICSRPWLANRHAWGGAVSRSLLWAVPLCRYLYPTSCEGNSFSHNWEMSDQDQFHPTSSIVITLLSVLSSVVSFRDRVVWYERLWSGDQFESLCGEGNPCAWGDLPHFLRSYTHAVCLGCSWAIFWKENTFQLWKNRNVDFSKTTSTVGRAVQYSCS